VTLTVDEKAQTYEVLESHREIRRFAAKFGEASSIVISGIEGNDRLMEKAVAAVYSNIMAELNK
jgi:hypothetical protein